MKRTLIIVLTVLLLLITAVGCKSNSDEKSDNLKSYNLYFANNEKTNLVVETRQLEIEESSAVPDTVMRELLKGPLASGMSAILTGSTKLLSVTVQGKVAKVDLSESYYENTGAKEILARYSIVNTLCDIDGIDKVSITIDGEPLLNSSKEPVGELGSEDIVINPSSDSTEKVRDVTMYFSDDEGRYLIRVKRNVTLADNNVAKAIVAELVKGPDRDGMTGTIPTDTQVISVEITEGICFVNLSDEFIIKNTGSTQQEMAVYSIVNSLTELPEINKVQFLIEGKKIDVFGNMIFNEPFEREESLIK